VGRPALAGRPTTTGHAGRPPPQPPSPPGPG